MTEIGSTLQYPSILIDGRGSKEAALLQAEKTAHELCGEQGSYEYIEPEKNKSSISIEQARDLRKKLTLKSKNNSYRVFIINDISLMGSQVQNSLLKVLEELGKNITILLPVASLEDVLPTIRSRSRVLSVNVKLQNTADNKQNMIDNATLGYKINAEITKKDILVASEFLKFSISDRLLAYKDKVDDKENIVKLLLSLRVLCISTMREVPNHKAKLAWSKKVEQVNTLLQRSQTNASAKLLLLAAAVQL